MLNTIVVGAFDLFFLGVVLYLAYKGCKQDMRAAAHPARSRTPSIDEPPSECSRANSPAKCAAEETPPSYAQVIHEPPRSRLW